MRKLFLFICALYFTFTLVNAAESNINNVWKIYSIQYSETTGLYTAVTSGSAVYLGDGKVITNAHVVLDKNGTPYGNYELCITYNFKDAPTCYNVGDLEKYDSELDLALLTVSKEYSSYPDFWKGATFSKGDEDIGDNVKIIGYPSNGGSNINLSQGKISGFSSGHFKTDADIDHGNSGGGAFDSEGKLIGVPTAISKDTAVIGYIIPIKIVKLFLASKTATSYKSMNQKYKDFWENNIDVLLDSTNSVQLDGISIKNIAKYKYAPALFYETKKLTLQGFTFQSKIDSTYFVASNGKVLESKIKYNEIWQFAESNKKTKYIKKHIKIQGKKVFLIIIIDKKTKDIALLFEYQGAMFSIYGNLKHTKGIINALKIVLKSTTFTGNTSKKVLNFSGYNIFPQENVFSVNRLTSGKLNNLTYIDMYSIDLQHIDFEDDLDLANYTYEKYSDYMKRNIKNITKNEIIKNIKGEIFLLVKAYDKTDKTYTYYFDKYVKLNGKTGYYTFTIRINGEDKKTFERAFKTFLMNLELDGEELITVGEKSSITNLNSFFK